MGKTEDRAAIAPDESSSWALPAFRDITGKVLGDFEVERLLGRGGMGEVYLARQVSLDRPVALKVLRPDLAQNPTYMARFESEAWAAARINHPNIVHIYTIGSMEGVRFIAMEYVLGTNLKEYLVKKGVPDLPLALAIMRQSAMAVGAAAEVGLIHRDIKPENLLLTKKGQVKVADFGLCRLPEAERMHLTQTGMTLGTPLYMSPEQVQGHDIDHRSDLYSLGVTFYHMLAGHPPFRGETAVALALKHVREEPPSLAAARPDLPPELVALVARLMAKAPADRYPSAAEMLRDLARIKEILQAQAHGGLALSGPMSVSLAAPVKTQVLELEDPDEAPPAGARPSALVLAAIGAVGLAIGGLMGWLGRSEDLVSASAPPSASLPALWMAPWATVPKQTSAITQYRYALTHSDALGREAAWLAVPGYYPNNHEESFGAYLQLARHYLRQGDHDRLRVLSAELKEAEAVGLHRERWEFLSQVIHAAEMAVLGEDKEVAFAFRNVSEVKALEPPIAELALEAVLKVMRKVEGQGGDASGLASLRNLLSGSLKMSPT